MEVKSCICTKEFEEAVSRVKEQDYKPIGDSLHKETKRSLEELTKRLGLQRKENSIINNQIEG